MSTVLNARGVPLAYSGAAVNHLSANEGTPTLTGSAQNDSFWGDSAVEVSMFGGDGDDIFHLYSAINRAFEAAEEGIDTVDTWMSYRLGANIENLIVTGGGRYAFGNGLDNIITGDSGRQTLDGRGGDDVLEGGGGSDVFVVTQGMGSDLILDFSPDDLLRLSGYDFTSYDALRMAMTQSADAVTIDLGDGDILVLAGTSVAELGADQFQLSLDLSQLSLAFEDQFDSLDLWDGADGTWDSNYWWGAENGSTLTNNNELQWYIDHDYAATGSVNPFSIDQGVLTITAARAAPEIQPLIEGYEYTSGMLTSYQSFAQTYGYFEIRADMPEGQGLWPSFWMLPADGSWPPELDVIERVGQNPNRLILTAHSNEGGNHTKDINYAMTADSDGFHRYGVLWDPEQIVWYYDGVEVARSQTPADMHQPMYMVVNLAVGGIAGTPGATLDSGAEMKVDYIRAYALEGVSEPGEGPLAGDDTILGTGTADTLGGGAGNDLLQGKAGDDRLFGQAGDDLLRGNAGLDYFDGGDGNDTVDYRHAPVAWDLNLAAGTATHGSRVETLVSIENVIGGKGDDTLTGDSGDNVLTGGAGADLFIFARLDQAGGDGNDRLTDFEKARDILAFRDLVDTDADGDVDLDDLLAAVTTVEDQGPGAAVVVNFDNGASITFAGVGSGAIDSLTGLVNDATTQLVVV